jgi:hypothetical protein
VLQHLLPVRGESQRVRQIRRLHELLVLFRVFLHRRCAALCGSAVACGFPRRAQPSEHGECKITCHVAHRMCVRHPPPDRVDGSGACELVYASGQKSSASGGQNKRAPGCVVSSKRAVMASCRSDGRCVTKPRSVLNPTSRLRDISRPAGVWLRRTHRSRSTQSSRTSASRSGGTSGMSRRNRENVLSRPSRCVWCAATSWFSHVS